ncbi:MAG TPA: hypothetical protein VGC45_10935 [Gryllotalpicola sp.]
MSSIVDEVWASPSVLMSYDGRVLEVFGLVDVARFHRGLRPQIVFAGKTRITIKPRSGGNLSFFFDPARRDEVEAFAARVHASYGTDDGAEAS